MYILHVYVAYIIYIYIYIYNIGTQVFCAKHVNVERWHIKY